MFVKARNTHEALKCRFLHARHMAEAHVVFYQGQYLSRIVIREAQAFANLRGDFYSDIDMIVEADAVRSHAKGGWLTHVMQQSSPRQCRRARLRQMFQQQESVHK